jgi:hypothetical protein
VNFIAYQTSTLSGCSDPSANTDTNSVQVVIEVESPTNFNDINESPTIVDCYPNPIAYEMFSIRSDYFIQSLEIYNSKGEKVYCEKQLNQRIIEVSTAQLNPGVYFVHVKTMDIREIVKKVLKL